ncbi:enoyl-CoA hydratase/isomerase family protein [Natronomonas marina]|jgi:2-(1,2-epoxy-1,2-dihydrophenyl)acetyl-CoA isomerase|uniref:enoyl-CoA hydratase/isomerase family protein n=1 Tax=Natronomonas marina TaxID=2961939 RepID=UPI0020C9564A|nr:enoyl-CoA hydratase-related protein [Natronomonas marina]
MARSDSYEEWAVSVSDHGIASVELRHEKDAIDERGMVEFHEMLGRLPHRDDVEVILLTGGSSAFCVGLDIATFVDIFDATEGDEVERQRRIRELIHRFHGAILEMATVGCPVIAAVNGFAAGGGFSIALASDQIIASADAEFTHAYTDIGASSDGGSTYFLPRLVGLQKAKELVFTPQPLSADRMAELGVVNQVVEEDFEETVRERARTLADRPTEAIARSKRLLNGSLDATLEGQLEREREDMAEIVLTEEFERRVRGFVRGEE